MHLRLAPATFAQTARRSAWAGAMALAGCVTAGEGALRAPKSAGTFEARTVTLPEGVFDVTFGAIETGRAHTKAGARGVVGRGVLVRGAGVNLRADQGALAKRAARRACAEAAGTFHETALGGYDALAQGWRFAGGCA